MHMKTISEMMLVVLLLTSGLMLAFNIDTGFALPGDTVWSIETVDSSGDVGIGNSIALDSGRAPHISYVDDTNHYLKYAYKDGGTWHTETVDNSGYVWHETSIALDSGDRPHISYYHAQLGNLKYAYFDGSTWQRETVDSSSLVGRYNSIALDSGNKPHISYCDEGNSNLKYAYKDGGTWHTETVDSSGDVGRWSSLALDGVNTPHISYGDYTNYDLKHAYYDGTMWYKEIVDSGYSSWDTSIAIDSHNWPDISYCGGDPNFDLNYARYYLGTWYKETADSNGDLGMWYSSLALNSRDYPHISYCDWTDYDFDLKYAYFDGSTWHTEIVDSNGDVGKYNSIALDSCNKPHISYYDSTNGNLKYASVRVTPPVQLTFNTINDWAPSITYSGKWFASETASDEIFVGPFDGSQPPSLITTNGNSPQISDYGTSEGDWVVVWTRYYPPPDPQADIYAYDNYHATEEQLTTTSWSDTWPSISRREAYNHLVVFNSYLGVTSELCGCELTEPHTFYQLTYDTPFSGWPSQSSGGKTAYNTGPAGESDHEIMVYSGGSIMRLTYNDIDDYGPSISDDGSRVVWYDNDYAGNTRIWRANSDGSQTNQIASGWDPEISGDGQWVVFVDDRTGDNEIYITSWNGGESAGVWNLSNDPSVDEQPSISSLTPCGTYHIVWSSDRASDDEIWGCGFVAPPPPAPPTPPSVGGFDISVDKFGLLAPYIGLASTILVATVATAIFVKRVKRRKEKQ